MVDTLHPSGDKVELGASLKLFRQYSELPSNLGNTAPAHRKICGYLYVWRQRQDITLSPPNQFSTSDLLALSKFFYDLRHGLFWLFYHSERDSRLPGCVGSPN